MNCSSNPKSKTRLCSVADSLLSLYREIMRDQRETRNSYLYRFLWNNFEVHWRFGKYFVYCGWNISSSSISQSVAWVVGVLWWKPQQSQFSVPPCSQQSAQAWVYYTIYSLQCYSPFPQPGISLLSSSVIALNGPWILTMRGYDVCHSQTRKAVYVSPLTKVLLNGDYTLWNALCCSIAN